MASHGRGDLGVVILFVASSSFSAGLLQTLLPLSCTSSSLVFRPSHFRLSVGTYLPHLAVLDLY